MATRHVVHRRGRWQLRRPDGGCTRSLRGARRSEAASGRLRREPRAVVGETRQPIPAAPGRPRRSDYEYRRNGTVNLSAFLDAHPPWRKMKITDQRTAQDFAVCMRDLVDVHYPQAELVRIVLDNLSTHTAGALYETFPAPEAHRILRRLEFHYTPKHASWLNMVEIELGVLRGQCLNRRTSWVRFGNSNNPICMVCLSLFPTSTGSPRRTCTPPTSRARRRCLT